MKVLLPQALVDGNQHIWIREKMLELSSTVLSTPSPYPNVKVYTNTQNGRMKHNWKTPQYFQ